ncbi:MAG: heme ABC exporter ATP-binding protein CcmA [Sphingorhabdus sp.]
MSPRQAYSPAVALENVAVIRGNRLVLNGFSLAASVGDIVWIRGANGSGKSTLLRLIAGLLPKTSGQMKIEGRLALADENAALDPNLPLEKALNFWAEMDGAAPDIREAALIAMDLVPLADVPIRYLSSGQRKRVNLSRLFASHASIWLLDEPYNGLDSANTARLDAALLRHSNSGGIALVAAHQSPSINVAQSILLDPQSTAV